MASSSQSDNLVKTKINSMYTSKKKSSKKQPGMDAIKRTKMSPRKILAMKGKKK